MRFQVTAQPIIRPHKSTKHHTRPKKIIRTLISLEPKQFKNNLIMLEDKPQFEFCRFLAGSNFEVDAQKNQNDV